MASRDVGTVPLKQPAVIDTDTSSSFVCEYVAGVNRVLSLPPYVLVDNIGRNVEVWRFQTGDVEPVARAIYDRTSYPDDPIASLLDVDLHAAFLRGGGHELLTINHFGRMRRFELPAVVANMRSTAELQLLGDIERFVMAGDCVIGSSPRGEFTGDAPQPGAFLFQPIPSPVEQDDDGDARRLGCDQVLADWGVITALAVSPAATRLAVAAGTRLGLFTLRRDTYGVQLGDCVWDATRAFHCQWLHLDETDRLWAAGHHPSSEVDGDDGNACRGGAIELFDIGRGCASLFAATLPEATAWGYGADPVVLRPDGCQLYVLGRDASLWAIDVPRGTPWQIYAPPDAAPAIGPSLGIGHAALRDRWVYAGFSRGGFRLFRYDLHQD